MSVMGLVESMRGEFRRALQPFKGGERGTATILRYPTFTDTGETVAIHYEQTRTADGGIHTYSESGMPGYIVFLQDILETPLTSRDRLTVNGLTLGVIFGSYPGNLTPADRLETELLRG